MTPADPNRIRRWRDRARLLVVTGVAIYAAGFFLDWLLAFEFYWVLTFGGGFVVLVGACCGLLWLVDSSTADKAELPPDEPQN